MDPSEKLGLVEARYRYVLDLACEQLKLLEEGRYLDLPPVLQRKSEAVEEAGRIMNELKAAADEGSRRAIQEGLSRLTDLVAQVMAIEDKCQGLLGGAPSAAPQPPRARVASLYQKNLK
jgi:hypothetical protein